MIELLTERLRIRDHVAEDIDGLHRLLTDERAMYFMDDIRVNDLKGAEDNLATAVREAERPWPGERECYFFAITLKDNTYVGEVGYTVKARTDKGAIVGMGYFVLPEFWGSGIVTEAVGRVVRFAFEQDGVWKIELGCNKGNPGSERVMQKNGMIKEGEFVDHTWLDHKLWNRVEYRLLKSEWLARQYGDRMLTWYSQHHRKLPWRETHDPYRIWVSEVMLQQTQVDTVIGYYQRFLTALPTIQHLASADEEVVFKLWEGLGYYSRARRLMTCAREIVSKYKGCFPNTYEALLKLPGIGPYTAGAVSSIAFNYPAPAVDGNVMRVISRQFLVYEDIGLPASRKAFEDIVISLLPEDRRHFNQALMELGATLCTPRNPSCDRCPVIGMCEGYKQGVQAELPVKERKQKKTVHAMALALVRYQGRMLITKRSSTGLLADLWALPMVACEDESVQVEQLSEELNLIYGLNVTPTEKSCNGRHVFTHRIWNMTLYVFEASEQKEVDFPKVAWVNEDELMTYAMPTAFVKMLDEIRKIEER